MGKKQKEELPDYTVASMDIEGMPWNSKRQWQIVPKKERPQMVPEDGEEKKNPFLEQQEQPLEKEDRRIIIGMALKAALLLGGVFVLAGFLFILFCVKVWF